MADDTTNQGIILKTAHADNRGLLGCWTLLIFICLAVFALNWKFLYNCVSGPVPFTAAYAASPGNHLWVKVPGKLEAFNLMEATSIRLKGIALPSNVTAKYKLAEVEGKNILVKVEADSVEEHVEGRVEDIPGELADAIKGKGNFYPQMVVATTRYWLDCNLFMLVAALAFPLSLLLWAVTRWRSRDVTRMGVIKDLKRHGSPLEVVQQIESEMAAADPSDKIEPFHFTKNWIVSLKPSLELLAVRDIVAIAADTKVKKANGEMVTTHLLKVWRFGHMMNSEFVIYENQVQPILSRIALRYPGIAIVGAKQFDDRWVADRKGCEAEARQREPR